MRVRTKFFCAEFVASWAALDSYFASSHKLYLAASASTEGSQGWNSKRNSGDKAVRKVRAAGKVQINNYVVLMEDIENCSVSWMERRAAFTRRTRIRRTDKVWRLNDNTHKALSMLATQVERFEATNKDLCDIDMKFDIEFDELS